MGKTLPKKIKKCLTKVQVSDIIISETKKSLFHGGSRRFNSF